LFRSRLDLLRHQTARCLRLLNTLIPWRPKPATIRTPASSPLTGELPLLTVIPGRRIHSTARINHLVNVRTITDRLSTRLRENAVLLSLRQTLEILLSITSRPIYHLAKGNMSTVTWRMPLERLLHPIRPARQDDAAGA